MKKSFFLLLTGLFTITYSLIAQTQLGSYDPNSILLNNVRSWQATAPELDPNVLVTRSLKDVKQTTQYFDGLGRPIQAVVRKGSLETSTGAALDLVSTNIYDNYGREARTYLPFVSTATDGSQYNGAFKFDPGTQQLGFMNAQYSGQNENGFYYSQTEFEPSPLSRPLQSFSPGASWVGNSKGVKQWSCLNTVTDDVKIWKVTNVAGSFGSYQVTGAYPEAKLSKAITEDEKGNQVIEFKDLQGKVILKKVQLTGTADDGSGRGYAGWLSTYYIYDDLGNLRAVIQPRGVELLAGAGWTLSTTLLAEQCFRYEYDYRGRMILKQVPGAREVRMVYDKRDRLILTQDANLRATNKWLFTKYDVLNRPVMTGFYTNSTYTTLSAMQDFVNSQNLGLFENSQTTGLPYYTLTNSFPQVSYADVQTVTYYDDYAWAAGYGFSSGRITSYDANLLSASNTVAPYAQALVQTSATKGMVTGSWDRTGSGLSTIIFYDEKGRVIQTQKKNITGGTDLVLTQYSWAGQPLLTIQKQEKAGTNPQTTVVVTLMTYDDLNRLTKIEKKLSNTQVNGNAMSAYKTIAQLEYDKMGQLKKKTLAPGFNSGAGLEALVYDYNIRGWMLGVNRSYLSNTSSFASYFGMELNYDKDGYSTTQNKQLNGNIGGTIWRSQGDGERRKYDFNYDAANRILAADFKQQFGSNWSTTNADNNYTINFSSKMGDGVNPLTAYDANGNILRMQQWGLQLGNSPQIDDLRYNYFDDNASNRLKGVTDLNNNTATRLGDFKTNQSHDQYNYKTGLTGSSTPAAFAAVQDYTYDDNGNLKTDKNKGIEMITYNHLNLPVLISMGAKGTIAYTYDNSGNKLKKITTDNAVAGKSITTTTTYLDGFVYESKTQNPADPKNPDYTDKLQFIPHEEGRIRFKDTLGTTPASFVYDYFIKDHLGNVRLVLTEETQQNIYPVASLENAGALTLEATYYKIDPAKVVAKTAGLDLNALSWQNNNTGVPTNNNQVVATDVSQKVYRINGGEATNTGLGITMKVMAGDIIQIKGRSYWKTMNNAPVSGTPSGMVIADLLLDFIGQGGGDKMGVSATTLNAAPGVASLITELLNGQSQTSTRPKAYVNWILFDENLRPVISSANNNSGFDAVGDNGQLKPHDISTGKLAKSGYLYVYCSNQSNLDLFFDNLQVIHNRGQILEENHYYPFGLIMASISGKAANFGLPENKRKFNDGSERNSEFEIALDETKFRLYNAQIGMFHQIDPLSDLSISISSFAYGNNNPILFNDPLGLISTKDNPQWLAPVVVKPPKKKESRRLIGFHWPNTKKDQSKWNDEMYARIRDKRPLVQNGDPSWLKDQSDFHKRNYQANQDYRKMQAGAVVLLCAPIAGVAIAETGATFSIIGSKITAEAGLVRTGAQLLGKKYGSALIGATALNIAQNGGDIKKLDAFDIATNTLNPYGGLSGAIGMTGINSLVDYNPFAATGDKLSTLGDGKNIFQAGFDFSFGLFGEAAKFTYVNLGGSNGFVGLFADIITGNTGAKAQELLHDKK